MSKDYHQHIKEYILGNLTEDQVRAMEQAMETDADLREAVDVARIEWEMQEILAENVLRVQIADEFERESKVEKERKGFSKSIWYLIALVGLSILVYFFLKQDTEVDAIQPILETSNETMVDTQAVNSETILVDTISPVVTPQPPIEGVLQKLKPNLQSIAMSLYVVPASLLGTRGASGSENFEAAQKAFLEEKFDQASRLLQVLPEDDYQEALSIRGHARFRSGDFTLALQDFDELLAGGIYSREAEWYGLLASLAKQGSKPADWALRLKRITDSPKHPYFAEAKKLESLLL